MVKMLTYSIIFAQFIPVFTQNTNKYVYFCGSFKRTNLLKINDFSKFSKNNNE
jgi:hypothetical protein